MLTNKQTNTQASKQANKQTNKHMYIKHKLLGGGNNNVCLLLYTQWFANGH